MAIVSTIPHTSQETNNGMKENVFQNKVREIAKKLEWDVYHVYFSQIVTDAGFPDLIMVQRDSKKMIAVELKAERGKVSDSQLKWLGYFESNNIPTFVWKPSDLSSIPRILSKISPPLWLAE